MKKILIFIFAATIGLSQLSCSGHKRPKWFDDPEEYFLAFPSNPRKENSNPHYSETDGYKQVRYDEILINNSSSPFKIVYRQRILRSPDFGEIMEDKNYDIKNRFGKSIINPKGQLFSDKSVFSAKGNIKNIVVTVKYCGHKVTKKGKPITNDGHTTTKIRDNQMTCAFYSLEIEPKRKFEERHERRFDYVYY